MNDDRCYHVPTSPGQQMCTCMDYIMWLRLVIQMQAQYIADLERRMHHQPIQYYPKKEGNKMTIPSSMLNQVPDITFESGVAAESVLDAMKAQIEAYGSVNVAEYRILANLEATFPDYKVGWTDLDEARIIYTKGEFMLDLPLVKQVP